MDCDQMKQLLDAFIDGELTDAQERELAEHAKACEACREELNAARLLRETLAHMDDDIEVPLKAQAAWRSAVRAEAKKKNARKWMRVAYAAAAALVVFFGANVVLNNGPEQAEPLAMDARALPETMQIIQKDGAADAAVYSAEVSQDYTVRKSIAVNDAEEAFESLGMLAAEYSGICMDEGSGICRIELPYDYMQDFLKAASRIGEEMESYNMIGGIQSETAVVLIQLTAK